MPLRAATGAVVAADVAAAAGAPEAGVGARADDGQQQRWPPLSTSRCDGAADAAVEVNPVGVCAVTIVAVVVAVAAAVVAAGGQKSSENIVAVAVESVAGA